MKVLITGGAGNIGSSLATFLAKSKENNIVVVDNLLTGNKNKLPLENKNLEFIYGDCNQEEVVNGVFSNYEFDYVFHYAAVVGVQRTLENPMKVLKDIDGFWNVLNASVKYNVKKVFFSSSSEVYGEPFEIPQKESTTPLNSRLPYAIVKNVGEAMFRTFFYEHNLRYSIFRFFNTYGPKQSDDFVISKFIKAALNNNDIYINGDGSQTRTFFYIDDNLEVTSNILMNDLLDNETMNLGSDVEISILELAQKIVSLLNSKSNIVHREALKEGDMTRRCPDATIMKGILNRDITPLDAGIIKTAKYFEEQQT